ncbi:hypothetical protein TGDOM2_293270 [Toxoplasma gondii GAB2-2007-GAL-DOM2]|uniref:Uncharacterized protein n=3 Tax=Toxoplasma gondii TaxID=5811 RepID=A0A086KS66_TOXGO|nr:hypothetical protein TGDOM2_293270 [Toxoplasma gondii GAB2-2007-GAL-DOM2]KFG47234.1 hypothetical protein TGFOU_293270 [Toxoplasma gondii FOU]KFH03201.1 hypothetical protein TGVAND_293270 [Toxoplasma gondii VAND]
MAHRKTGGRTERGDREHTREKGRVSIRVATSGVERASETAIGVTHVHSEGSQCTLFRHWVNICLREPPSDVTYPVSRRLLYLCVTRRWSSRSDTFGEFKVLVEMRVYGVAVVVPFLQFVPLPGVETALRVAPEAVWQKAWKRESSCAGQTLEGVGEVDRAGHSAIKATCNV